MSPLRKPYFHQNMPYTLQNRDILCSCGKSSYQIGKFECHSSLICNKILVDFCIPTLLFAMPLLVPILPIVFWDRPSWSFDAAASEPQSSSLHVAICHGKLQVLIVQCGKHSFLRSLISFWGHFFLAFLLITQSKVEENQKFSYALHTYCPESVQKLRIEFPCCCYIGHDSS